MGFTIFIREQVNPKYHPGSGAINKGPAPVYPAGAGLVYAPATLDIYSADPADRKVLLSDPNGTASSVDIFAAFPEIREPKKKEIRDAGELWLEYVTGDYSRREKDTFTLQQRQAEEWLLDNNAECRTVRKMAVERGITVAEMVAKIMENVPPFETGIGIILGKQQRLLDQIDAATDYEQLQGVTW